MSNTGSLDVGRPAQQPWMRRFETIFGHDWFEIESISGKSTPGWSTTVDLAALTAFALLIFSLTGLWYFGSDDSGYVGAARNWIQHFPFISHFFGDLRHPVVLPIAASIALFGDNELAVCLPTLLYSLGAVLVTYGFLARLADRATALLAAVLVSCLPLLGELSTTPNVDVAELFFVACSLLVFFYATLRRDRAALFFLAGVSSGLALLCRETSAALVLFYGILFLAGFGRRSNFWIMAAGFVAIYSSELILYWATVGDPLYRFKLVRYVIAFGGDRTAGTGALDFGAQGIFNLSPFLDPILYVIAHPKFALMFVAGLAAFIWSAAEPGERKDQTRLIRHLFLFGVVSLLVVEIGTHNMAQVPRYRLVSAYAMTLAAAIWLRSGLWRAHKKAAISILAILLFAEFAGSAISNNNPNFALRALASVAANRREPIHTDIETMFRGGNLFGWAKVEKRVTSAPPRPGDLFFYNPRNAGVRNIRTAGADLEAYKPKPSWQVLAQYYQPDTMASSALRLTGLSRIVPKTVLSRMRDSEPAILYRVSS